MVATLDHWCIHPPQAVPDHVGFRVLTVFVSVVVHPGFVGLSVAVLVQLDFALPLVSVVGAVLVLHVLVVHLVLDAVVGQGEWGDRLLARSHEHGPIHHGCKPRVVVGIIPDFDEDTFFAVVRRYLQLRHNRVILGGAVELQVSWVQGIH